MSSKNRLLYFSLFNEIGIISQLTRTLIENQMPEGMLLQHFTVLNHLIRVQDGRSPLALARAFQIPKTSMTHTLAFLEKNGLVKMLPNPDDGRSKLVWLTKRGRNLREQIIAQLDPDMDQIRADFPPVKAEKLVEVLQELRRLLDDYRDG